MGLIHSGSLEAIMGIRFWIQRSATVLVATFLLLLAVERLKHHGWEAALTFSALWATLSTAAYIAALLYRVRKARACALCNDLPQKVQNP